MELNTQHERTSSETSDDDSGAQYRVNQSNSLPEDKVINLGKIITYNLSLFASFLGNATQIIRAPLGDALPQSAKSTFDVINSVLSTTGLASSASYSLVKNWGTYKENKALHKELRDTESSNGGALMAVGMMFSVLAIAVLALALFGTIIGIGLVGSSTSASLGLVITSMVAVLAAIVCIPLGHHISASSLRTINNAARSDIKVAHEEKLIKNQEKSMATKKEHKEETETLIQENNETKVQHEEDIESLTEKNNESIVQLYKASLIFIEKKGVEIKALALKNRIQEVKIENLEKRLSDKATLGNKKLDHLSHFHDLRITFFSSDDDKTPSQENELSHGDDDSPQRSNQSVLK